MDIQKSVKQAWEILTLKQPTMQAVAKDPNALKPALIILAGASVIAALGGFIFPSTIGMVTYRLGVLDFVVQAAVSVGLGIAVLYTTGYLAQYVFHSKLDMNGLVQVMGHAMLVSALGIFSPLSSIAGIWTLVVLCTVLHSLGKMQAGSIILLILLEILIVGVFSGILVFVGVGAGLGGMMF
ncbi:MAG: hypothetical protein WC924_03245 [Candidatus Gracilibacteria bacterium]